MSGRAGLIPPRPEFIAAVQETARENGALVIADEILDLRQRAKEASVLHSLVPDLITMGKIIGGGPPIGAIGGRRDVMRVFDASAGQALLSQRHIFSQPAIYNGWAYRHAATGRCGLRAS
ncbi:aminotransferase class III-fold pyridoxal phosphate-dependent enzyme [Bradyrhizobium elkanii]|uniref:aminotransferase class III-fold pyridoxal phosphate-dependent enzyme n=1 Tax=Bradyrhizobium elkanii TaxID=29448 RepID=UPI00201371EB|nr:aminotransferase class III-fold pyridoxal phosphate-dependent enzyme [Bradyrhizobium elkanii]